MGRKSFVEALFHNIKIAKFVFQVKMIRLIKRSRSCSYSSICAVCGRISTSPLAMKYKTHLRTYFDVWVHKEFCMKSVQSYCACKLKWENWKASKIASSTTVNHLSICGLVAFSSWSSRQWKCRISNKPLGWTVWHKHNLKYLGNPIWNNGFRWIHQKFSYENC